MPRRASSRTRTLTLLAALALPLAGLPAASARAGQEDQTSTSKAPAFSEEREAAALHFIRKHAPDLIPIVEKLRASDNPRYRDEIREVFQICEWLTELREQEGEKRYALELDVWKTETKALILVAKMASTKEEEQAAIKELLQEHARKLVDLDMQILRLRVDQLEKELTDAREELNRSEEKREHLNREKYDQLLEKARTRAGNH
jgi:hypothetical protein